MDYERYDRFFVLLEGQNEEFTERRGAETKGHIKIETGNHKGAMRIGVQNVKYQRRGEYEYKLILFGTREEQTIHAVVGTVEVGRMGSGETYFRFDPLKMNAEGHVLADFSHAIVAAASKTDDREPLHPVLKGRLLLPEEAPSCFNAYYNQYVSEQCQTICQSRDVYDRVVPFREDATGAEWTKVTGDLKLPIVSPGAQRMTDRYKHYIFGENERYYYLGVPGRFLREEQPESGSSGFTLWQPILGAEEYRAMEESATQEIREMAYGYWIIAVDRKTGDIVEA